MSVRERVAAGTLLALVLRDVRAMLALKRLQLQSEDDPGTDPDVIAVAVVREDPALVRDTVRHFRSLQTKATIVVVLPPNDDSALLLCPSDAHVHVSATESESKGAMLNDFVRNSALGDDVFLSIYDADSRPTTVRHRACVSRPVSQQTSIYRPVDGGRPYWVGFAMNQTLWACSYERNSLASSSCYYLVGHGLTVQLALLRAQPFREDLPGEDILLGYQLSLQGVRPAISPGTDVAEIAVTTVDHLRQGGRWFVGELTALADISREHGATMLVARRVAGLAFWLAGPLLVSWILRTAFRPDHGRVRLLLGVAAVTRTALFLQMAQDPGLGVAQWSKPRCAAVSAVGFAAKPVVSALAGWWGVLQIARPSRIRRMTKSRTS